MFASASHLSLSRSVDGTYTRIVEENRDNIRNLKPLFNEIFSSINSSHCCVFVTGSDGRLEKVGKSSPFEIIAVMDESIDVLEKASIQEKIVSIIKENPDLFYHGFEVKELGPAASMIEFNGKVIPTRAFDAKQVWGSTDLKRRYYEKVFDDLRNTNAISYRKFSVDFRLASRSTLKKALGPEGGGERAHCDIAKGKLYLDGEWNHATKYPCLRPVQYTVAHLVFRGVRDGSISYEQFTAARKCRSIAAKLQWLAANNIVKQDISPISRAYVHCVQWFHEAELAKHALLSQAVGDFGIVYRVDAARLKEFARTILTFAESV